MLLSNKINEDKLLGPFFAFSEYIPEFDDNRNKIAQLDRTLIVESMLQEYLK